MRSPNWFSGVSRMHVDSLSLPASNSCRPDGRKRLALLKSPSAVSGLKVRYGANGEAGTWKQQREAKAHGRERRRAPLGTLLITSSCVLLVGSSVRGDSDGLAGCSALERMGGRSRALFPFLRGLRATPRSPEEASGLSVFYGLKEHALRGSGFGLKTAGATGLGRFHQGGGAQQSDWPFEANLVMKCRRVEDFQGDKRS